MFNNSADLGLILVLSALLYWLRAAIDQRKGAIVEVVAVTLPIGISALATLIARPGIGMLELGFELTPTVVFIFLCLPAIAGVRFVERLGRGEQPQLSDLFRLTTVTALGTFVVNLLRVDFLAVVCVSLMTLAYASGDILRTISQLRRRIAWLALAMASSWVVWYFMANVSWPSPTRYVDIVMELPLFVLLGLLVSPFALHWLLDRRLWLQKLGYWTQVIEHRLVKPRDAITQRTLFRLWHFREGVCYLNHGSFGAVPELVRREQHKWQEAVADEPMDMLARQTVPAWQRTRDQLANWLGSRPECMALCENATVAMNEVAAWFPLSPGDEVLLTDHEYGAVKRIWERRTARSGAELKYVTLPLPLVSHDQVVDAILAACTSNTKLVVISHITSPTAILLPVEKICAALRQRNIASCIDGPHALLQQPINLEQLDCDFYTASCHKWLCAPIGSGFVYVHSRWHDRVEPLRLSWGLLPPDSPKNWIDELNWIGTRDYSPYVAITAALQYFSRFGYEWLDGRNHALACYARNVISESLGTEPLTPESREWFGWMVGVWLPTVGPHGGDHSTLQKRLWERYNIEVPIMRFADRYLVRVSCHLYNTTHDMDLLARKLVEELSAPVGRSS